MKKILPMLAIMLAVVALSSCNPMERKAKNRIKECMKQFAMSDDYSIDSMNVVYSNDTICVVTFASKGLGIDGEPMNKWEYYLTKNTLSNGGCVVRDGIWPMDGLFGLRTPFVSFIPVYIKNVPSVKDDLKRRGLQIGTKAADDYIYSLIAQAFVRQYGAEIPNEGF